MPAGMALKSECFASNLSDPERRYTLEQFCAARGMAYARTGVPLAIADFVDYADWFQRQAAPEIWDATLRDLRWNGGAFELTARRPPGDGKARDRGDRSFGVSLFSGNADVGSRRTCVRASPTARTIAISPNFPAATSP